MEDNKEASRADVIKKTIKSLERSAKYSKNPLEQRQFRTKIGKLQRELKALEG